MATGIGKAKMASLEAIMILMKKYKISTVSIGDITLECQSFQSDTPIGFESKKKSLEELQQEMDEHEKQEYAKWRERGGVL